jgi:hypothetical protein
MPCRRPPVASGSSVVCFCLWFRCLCLSSLSLVLLSLLLAAFRWLACLWFTSGLFLICRLPLVCCCCCLLFADFSHLVSRLVLAIPPGQPPASAWVYCLNLVVPSSVFYPNLFRFRRWLLQPLGCVVGLICCCGPHPPCSLIVVGCPSSLF